MRLNKRSVLIYLGALAAIATVAATLALLTATPTVAQTAVAAATARPDPQLVGWAFISAALSTGLAALAAGFAVARVGSGAVGAVAEKPELFGRVLVLVGLAEGIAIYGLIVSILILNRVA
jgi:V/A-type H+/Na+-transporting ATPase subunit K